MSGNFDYYAFISYSHKDMAIAKWVQKKLESYRLPAELYKQHPDAPKAMKIFRDQTDLAGIELTGSIENELNRSRFLIVICSPNSSHSFWVNEEIKYFKKIGREDSIIPFIVDGEPESDDPAIECYPEELLKDDGKHLLGANIKELGKNNAFLKLLSILMDIRFNRIVDREKKRRRKRIGVSVSSITVVAAVIIALLWTNYMNKIQNEVLSYQMYSNGLMHMAGGIEELDYNEAVRSFTLSSEAGNSDAMLWLAYCCKNGLGTDKDDTEAFEWYKKAAEAGNVDGMFNLALCFEEGLGTDQDPEASVMWLEKAADKGSGSAMNALGWAYIDGYVVESDENTAFQWFERSANAGNDLGMYNLASCYISGTGTEPDPEKAFEWISKAAEAGNKNAMYNLAICYEEGLGVEADEEKAKQWREKAEN